MIFTLAFAFGIARTFGPLVQNGVAPAPALKDPFLTETPPIAVMEITATGADLRIAGSAGMGQVVFWLSLVVSPTLGLVADYPVSVLLLRYGMKGCMRDPRRTGI